MTSFLPTTTAMRWVALATILFIVAAGTGVWVLKISATTNVPLGFVGSLTGPHSEIGQESCDGAALAVEECNASGGCAGRQVDLLICDDGGSSKKFVEAISFLASRKVHAAIGPTSSPLTATAAVEGQKCGIILISPNASIDRDMSRDAGIFSMYPSGAIIAEWISQAMARQGFHNPAIVLDITIAPDGLASALQRYVPLVGKRIATLILYDPSSDVGMNDIAKAVVGSHPDCVIVFATSRNTGYLAQRLRQMSSTAPLIIGEMAATPTLIATGGSAVEGVSIVGTVDRNGPQDRLFSFRRKFAARFGYEPGFAAIHGYDAARVLISVLARGSQPQDIRNAIVAQNSFETIQARVMLGKGGTVRRKLFLDTVRDGAIRSQE